MHPRVRSHTRTVLSYPAAVDKTIKSRVVVVVAAVAVAVTAVVVCV